MNLVFWICFGILTFGALAASASSRVEKIDKASKWFIYFVSICGPIGFIGAFIVTWMADGEPFLHGFKWRLT